MYMYIYIYIYIKEQPISMSFCVTYIKTHYPCMVGPSSAVVCGLDNWEII